MRRIILASASPRRRQLLEQAGIKFELMTSTEEETAQGESPQETVMMLSRRKAENVEKRTWGDRTIIGADTVVAIDGKILGKPADDEQALAMLTMLQGNVHQVYTGVTIIEDRKGSRNIHTFYRKTDVEMYPEDEPVLRKYIATGEGRDKAGSYAIQGLGAVFVRSICGDYNNVVGLPASEIWQYLFGRKNRDRG